MNSYDDEYSLAQRAGEVALAVLVWVVAPIASMCVAALVLKRWVF